MEADPLPEVELMNRRFNGIEVFLMWCQQTNIVSIVLNDLESEQSSTFTVPNDKALHAFEHPFAYRPREVA